MGTPSAYVASAIQIGIVDDDASVGKALARVLRGYGYGCVVFESGEAALAAPELHQMRCLIIDIQMGGMNGFEFCDRLRNAGFYIPYVLITAYLDPERPATRDSYGHEPPLIKPIDEHELLASIARAMGGSGKQEPLHPNQV